MADKHMKSLEDLQKFADETVAKLGSIDNLDSRVGEVAASVKELGDKVKALGSQYRSDDPALGKHKVPISKAEFERGAYKALYRARTGVKTKVDGSLLTLEEPDGPFAEWQRAGDDLQILTAIKSAVEKKPVDPTSTRFYAEKYLPALRAVDGVLKDAMDTAAAGPGAGNWIPTEMGRDLEPLLTMQLRALSFIRRVDLPRSPFDVPRESARPTLYLKPETPESVTAVRTNQMADALGTASIAGKTTFSARVLAGVVTVTDEADEDSIIPLIPFHRDSMVRQAARTMEDAFINGDSTGAHMDSDIDAITNDHRKSWDGLRAFGLANTTTRVSAGGNAVNSAATWSDYILELIARLGESGGEPDDRVLVTGFYGLKGILGIPDFRTMYAVANQATAVTGGGAFGAALRPDGMNLVTSPFSREILNASGVFAAASTLITHVVFNRMAWLMGQIGGLRVDVFRDSYLQLWGQSAIALRWRGDIKAVKDPTAATQTHTGIVYNAARG